MATLNWIDFNNGETLLNIRTQLNSFNSSVETQVNTNTGDIVTLGAQQATNTADITTNANNIATNAGDIATNTTNIATNTSNISTNTADILALTDGTTAINIQTYNPQADISTLTEGQVAYDMVSKTLVVKSDIPDQTLNVGQETLMRVYNGTGATIVNGAVCRQIGVQAGVPSVGLAIASNFSTAIVSGVATHDIANGTEGYLTVSGEIGDILTNQGGETWQAGDFLFLSNVTPGAITTIQPPVSSIMGVLLTNNGTTGNMLCRIRSLNTLPPVGGWMKAIPSTIAPNGTYQDFTNFTDTSTSVGLTADGATGTYTIDNQGTYEISLSVSFSGITAQTNGSIIAVDVHNVGEVTSLFEYNVIVGRNDTVASGSFVTQGDFLDGGQLVTRFKEISGGVGTGVVVNNISFLVKSILIR